MSNPTLIVLLTKKEAQAAGITLPVTRAYVLNDATVQHYFAPVIHDMKAQGTPHAIVIERETKHEKKAAVWRGNPPIPARTSHQFRRENYAHVVTL